MTRRKRYETSDDYNREKQIATRVELLWNAVAVKLPISYHMDYLLLRDESPVAFAEIKRRQFRWGRHPDVMIALGKVVVARSLLNATGLNTAFVVRSDDSLQYCWLVDARLGADTIRFGGRTVQTRDSADVEPVIHIPRSHFTELETYQPEGTS